MERSPPLRQHKRTQEDKDMSLTLTSPAFPNGAVIPTKYTCSGADLSPALAWSGVPSTARSLALIVDDPDAPSGTWTHWLLWNLPVTLAGLPERVPPRESFENGSRQGKNDFGNIGYGGPCPPPGKPHRYFFRLYAFDAVLALNPGANRQDLDRAMKGHIQARAEYMGTYGR
jgi:hypothetical protein